MRIKQQRWVKNHTLSQKAKIKKIPLQYQTW